MDKVNLALHDDSGLHADMTWLVGALARDLMARGRNPGVIDMLSRLSACDFSTACLRPASPRTVAICRYLPDAVTATLPVAQETASALAAASEHLGWKEKGEEAAVADVLGGSAPLKSNRMRVSLLLMAPGATLRLPSVQTDRLFFLLAGPSRWRTDGGTLLAMKAGQTLYVTAGHGVSASSGTAPLLAVEIRG